MGSITVLLNWGSCSIALYLSVSKLDYSHIVQQFNCATDLWFTQDEYAVWVRVELKSISVCLFSTITTVLLPWVLLKVLITIFLNHGETPEASKRGFTDLCHISWKIFDGCWSFGHLSCYLLLLTRSPSAFLGALECNFGAELKSILDGILNLFRFWMNMSSVHSSRRTITFQWHVSV